jgi:uncharacterized protein (TIGR02444 family)
MVHGMNDPQCTQDEPLLDNPFWQFSLTVYQQPNCADFLLDAQNRYGIDINVLLFIGWLAHEQKSLKLSPMFKSTINDFQQDTIAPIRKIRIAAKKMNNVEFYERLKRLELVAENIEQQRLYRLSDKMPLSNKGLSKSIEQSINVYIGQNDKGVGLIQEMNWLQTLIQYLQPDTRL